MIDNVCRNVRALAALLGFRVPITPHVFF